MCNVRIRTNCFRYKVFGMPFSKKKLLDNVKLGTKLFLFEYEARKLWGIYEAALANTFGSAENMVATSFDKRAITVL